MKRCSRCRKFLSAAYHHRLCRKCKRIVNKLADMATVAKIHNMRFARASAHKARGEKIAEAKAEVYLGKKAPCGLCEEMAHLSKHRRFAKPVCKECYNEIETRLVYL